jgi:hypothetical protein
LRLKETKRKLKHTGFREVCYVTDRNGRRQCKTGTGVEYVGVTWQQMKGLGTGQKRKYQGRKDLAENI